MSDIEQRLRERATSYRQGGPSSEHTASILDEAADRIASLRSKLEEAEGALEPFATILEEYDPEDDDDNTPGTFVAGSVTNYELTLGDLRRARRTLASLREADHA